MGRGGLGYRNLGEVMLMCCVCTFRLAPYERRVTELLRNSKDKRARKLAKKRVSLFPTPGHIRFLFCRELLYGRSKLLIGVALAWDFRKSEAEGR